MTCEHNVIECPKHKGNWDCHSFCPLCEGYGEYCGKCGANGGDVMTCERCGNDTNRDGFEVYCYPCSDDIHNENN
jgi:hypothetical protein